MKNFEFPVHLNRIYRKIIKKTARPRRCLFIVYDQMCRCVYDETSHSPLCNNDERLGDTLVPNIIHSMSVVVYYEIECAF